MSSGWRCTGSSASDGLLQVRGWKGDGRPSADGAGLRAERDRKNAIAQRQEMADRLKAVGME